MDSWILWILPLALPIIRGKVTITSLKLQVSLTAKLVFTSPANKCYLISRPRHPLINPFFYHSNLTSNVLITLANKQRCSCINYDRGSHVKITFNALLFEKQFRGLATDACVMKLLLRIFFKYLPLPSTFNYGNRLSTEQGLCWSIKLFSTWKAINVRTLLLLI